MGVKVWPSLSVSENRLPSASMTLRDEVSIEPAGRSSSALAVTEPAVTKLAGVPSATAAIAAGSPHGGMSWNARFSSMSLVRSRAYSLP